MGYIGNQTSNSFTSMDKQSITGNGTTGPYTLTHAVANDQEIEVFVNNVRQEPGVAYTVSGNAMTMTGNVAASDDFYVVFQGKAIQTTVPGDDTITAAMIKDNAVAAANIADGAITNAKLATGIAASKLTGPMPAIDGSSLTGISAFPKLVGVFYKNANQTISSNSQTTVTWDSTITDPDNILYNSGVQIRPTETGWYKFEWRIQISQADMNKGVEQFLEKNGSTVWHDNRPAGNDTDGGGGGPHGFPICFAYGECTTANSDVFEVSCVQGSGSRTIYGYVQNSRMATHLAVYKLT